jgi:penicillin-binding protein 1A
MRRFVKFLAFAAVGLMTAAVFAAIAFGVVLQRYSSDLPSVNQLASYSPAVVTRLYASDGRLLAEYAKEKRVFMPLSAIPKTVQNAFLSAEDQNFYQHKGVDVLGILRAVKENIANYGSGRSMVGGSTITQQVVKNFLLTSEKSFERKAKEAILAYRISNIYSKDKILELYLNEIYLGQSAYGVAAASLNYFNKPLDELSTEEAALLAALPKAPAYYDPAKNYAAALERRNYVINRMVEDGYITPEEATRAAETKISLKARDAADTAHADYFAEEVRRRIAQMYGTDVLYKGGLFVKTTVDPKLQKHADNALRHALTLYDRRHGYRGPLGRVGTDGMWDDALLKFQSEKRVPLFGEQNIGVVLTLNATQAGIGLMGGKRVAVDGDWLGWARRYARREMVNGTLQAVPGQLKAGDVVLVEPVPDNIKKYRIAQVPEVNGALVVLDPHTGRVLALSGGYAYGGPDQFNRATQAKRQPGSAFKPFVYLTALENGFNPTSIVLDGPIELSQGEGLPMWKPKNYEQQFMGPTTLRRGLEKSRNTMTVRLAVMLGIHRIQRMAERFGVYPPTKRPNFSMVLGANETTLLTLVNAYGMVVNGGRKVEPALIERIDDRNGTTIYRRDVRDCVECRIENTGTPPSVPPTIADDRDQLIDPRISYQLVSMLEGVVLRGTAASARVLGRPVGGKTGTTNESRDAWFVGFTPDLVIGAYVGYDTPKPMGAKETGGRVALPGFIHFVQNALKDAPKDEFRRPPGIQMIPVNAATGQPLYYGEENQAGAQIVQEAFVVGGEIFKPKSEEDAEAADPAHNPPINTSGEAPEILGLPFDPEQGVPAAEGFESPGGPSSYAPLMPRSESGFDPGAPAPGVTREGGADTGTGGLY